MGFQAGNTIADLCFYALAERDVMAEHARNFKCWWRRKDEIVFIAYSVVAACDVRESFNARQGTGFIVGKWEFSMGQVEFLDIDVYKPLPIAGFLGWRTRFKPSGLGIPLSSESVQLAATHRAWQLGEVRRFASTCSSRENFIQARTIFINRLVRLFEVAHLNELQAYDPWSSRLLPTVPRARPATCLDPSSWPPSVAIQDLEVSIGAVHARCRQGSSC